MEHCLQRFHHFSCIRVLDQRANTICCAISWEGLRLRQFGDKTGMMSGLKNNTLDWDGIRIILDRLKVSLGEEDSREYGLALAQGTTQEDATLGEADNPGAVNRFGRLFGKSSTAMARKTGWVKTSLEGMQELLSDSSRLIRLLYGTLETSVRIELLNAQQRLLEEAVLRSLSDSDRQMVYQLAQRTFGLEDVKNTSPKLEAYNKQLLEAIDENDERTVKYLLDQGASANTRDPLGCSPLTFSARKGRLRISEILLSRGADPKAMKTRLPQHSAAEGGHTEVLRLLLSQNSVDPSAVDSFGRTALHYASGSGNPTAVQYLLKLDGIAVDSVDEGGSTPLFAAVAKHFFSLPWGEPGLDFTLPEKEIVRQLLAIPEVDPNRQHLGRFGQTLLCTALWKQAMTIVEMLLARPDIDIHKPSVSGANPIFIAVFRSNKTAVRLLLEKGANINERFLNTKVYKKFRYSTPGFWGKEFLEFALSHGKAQVARKDYSRRRIELITAAERGHTSVVRILLDCGASVSESDDQGRTALSWAAACGHEGIVEMLLSANADIHHRDNKGHTPLVLAVANLRRVPDLRDLRHSLERAELRVQRAHVNVIWSLLENYANPGDVPSTQEPPCNPARWAEAKGKFEGILEGCFGNSDDESITQNPDQPVLESSLAHTSWQEGVLAVSKPSDKDGEVYRAVEVNEVDLDRVPKPGSSTLPDDGGLAKQLRCKPNELAAEHSEGNHHSEGNKEIQAEKPIAPVLYLELEDDLSAKLKF